MAEAHPTPAHGTPPAAPAEHHGSWAPIVTAASAIFLYLALVNPPWLVVGLPLLFIGVGKWLHEDMVRFRHGHMNPTDAHGWPGGLWGMILFIGTEVLIFGSIFAVWFVAKAAAAGHGMTWPPTTDLGEQLHLPVIWPTGVNTAILVASGGTLHMGFLRLKRGDQRGYLALLGATIVLGAVFLGLQVREYVNLIREGLSLSAFHGKPSVYGSTFYMLTGTHGAHVFGGLVALMVVFWRSWKKTQTSKNHLALEAVSIYWHFVDVVWIFLFVVVYLQWL